MASSKQPKRQRGFVYIPPEKKLRTLFNEYLDANGMTKKELGELVGEKESTVSSCFCRCTWSFDRIRKYAKALNIPPDELGKTILY